MFSTLLIPFSNSEFQRKKAYDRRSKVERNGGVLFVFLLVFWFWYSGVWVCGWVCVLMGLVVLWLKIGLGTMLWKGLQVRLIGEICGCCDVCRDCAGFEIVLVVGVFFCVFSGCFAGWLWRLPPFAGCFAGSFIGKEPWSPRVKTC